MIFYGFVSVGVENKVKARKERRITAIKKERWNKIENLRELWNEKGRGNVG